MLYQQLQLLEASKTPIRLGVSATGWMGSGFIAQLTHVPGMEAVILADPNVEAAYAAFLATGFERGNIQETDDPNVAMDAIRAGKRVVTHSLRTLVNIDLIDILVDVTPSPAIGAETAYYGIQAGKDVVLVNIEADVTVGPILHSLAQKYQVLYTVSSGDEPGCLMQLYDFVNSLGFEPIVIGKGKNNPLDPTCTPKSVRMAAEKAQKDAYQVSSYVDGTKTMFEMACAANATGCKPMKRGMFGPQANLETVSQVFALEPDGGITTTPPAVDFVQGSSMAGGVFVTVRVTDDRIANDLAYLKVGFGKYFTFFRPYHLWFLEAPISIAQVFLHRKTTLVPLDVPVAEVLTLAKRDLLPGDRLDDFGGYTYHGVIDKFEVAQSEKALPAGLAPGARIKNRIPKGSVVTWNDVELDESSTVVQLRRQQDQIVAQ